MGKKEEILDILPKDAGDLFMRCDLDFSLLQEIRMRVGQPLQILYQGQKWFLSRKGTRQKTFHDAFYVTERILKETLNYIAEYSIYAFQEELRQGFLTVKGGHRVGVAGKVILDQNRVAGVKYLSSMNIRIAHERKGCANQLLPYLFQKLDLMHTLILSPPGCGKTTLLRDLIRKLSNGGFTIGVVDERSEICACYMGIPQNDVGIQTDIMDACPKTEGILMLIRSMAPQIVAVDEIGGKEDLDILQYGMTCGCIFLATMHGKTVEEVVQKTGHSMFQRYIVLESVGKIQGIFDGKGERLCGMLEL